MEGMMTKRSKLESEVFMVSVLSSVRKGWYSRVLVAELVVEVLAHLLQNWRRNFRKLHLTQLCFCEAACGICRMLVQAMQHC